MSRIAQRQCVRVGAATIAEGMRRRAESRASDEGSEDRGRMVDGVTVTVRFRFEVEYKYPALFYWSYTRRQTHEVAMGMVVIKAHSKF